MLRRSYSRRPSSPSRRAHLSTVRRASVQPGLDGALPGRHLCGQALTVDPAARGALFTVLSMFAAGATPGGAGMDGLLQALLLLVEESLCSQSQAGLPAERLQRRLAEARRLVLAQLGNPALGPKQLAQTLHMSLRSLYSLFDQMGMSPAAFIQTERLARCHAELADHRGVHRVPKFAPGLVTPNCHLLDRDVVREFPLSRRRIRRTAAIARDEHLGAPA